MGTDGQQQPGIGVVFGLPFHRVTMDEALAECERVIASGRPEYMVTANLDFTRLAAADLELKGILFHARRVLCDGRPLVWLSRLFGGAVPERVAGSDLVPRLLRLSAEKGYRIYLLGGDEGTLEVVAERLGEEIPGLQIAGRHSPPYGPLEAWDNRGIVEGVREVKPDILLVAVGCPKQEKWIARYHEEIGVPLSIGVGASLDFIAGKQVRSPEWMQRIGLEWFWRMARSPRRLVGRYAKDLAFLVRAAWVQWWAMEVDGGEVRSGYTPRLGEVVVRYGEVLPDEMASHVSAVVCDCGSVKRVGGRDLGILAEYAREAKRRGLGFRIANPPKGLRKFVSAFRLEGELPLEGGAGARENLPEGETAAADPLEIPAHAG